MISPTNNRIIVTEKGKKLQEQLRDPLLEFSLPPSTKSIITSPHRKPLDPFRVANNYETRIGYLRPKLPEYPAPKVQEPTYNFPNYLKRDPREYPSKHQCSWHEKLTVKGSHETPMLYPLNKTLHHTLYSPQHQQHRETPTTIRETNKQVEGKFGYIPFNLTTCQYPQYESAPNVAKMERLKDSLQIVSHLHDVSSFNATPTKFAQSNNTSRYETDRISPNRFNTTFRTHTENSLDATSYSIRKVNMKKSEEKSDQLIRKFVQQQIDYGELLHKVDKKVKENHEIRQENPEYLAEVFDKIHQSDSIIKNILAMSESEEKRGRLRLKEAQEKKYGSYWRRQKIFEKKKPGDSEKSVTEKESVLPPIERNIPHVRRISQGHFQFKLPQYQPPEEKSPAAFDASPSRTPSLKNSLSKAEGSKLLEQNKFDSYLSGFSSGKKA